MNTAAQLMGNARRHAVPVTVAILLAAATMVFWRPLVAWFTGEPLTRGGSSPGVKQKAGALAIEASLEPDPPLEKGNTLRLRISDSSGAPVEGASVRVQHVMPAMGSMPEMRGSSDVADRGGGRYDARFDLPMTGSWTLEVDVRAASASGKARFTLMVGSSGLTAAGGTGTGGQATGQGRARTGTDGATRASGAAPPGESRPQTPRIPSSELPASALSALQNAFAAHEEVRALLAHDRLEGLTSPARIVSAQVRAAADALGGGASEMSDCLKQAVAVAEKLAAATSLDEARAQFGELGRFLIAIGGSDARLQAGWHVFQCPMAKGFNRWFQRSAKLENPYMGQAMGTCGSEVGWQVAEAARAGAAASTTAGGGASNEGHGHKGDDVAYYTCSMHPSVEKKEPGTCPICSMNLVPVTYDETESGEVRVDEKRRQLIGLRTSKVVRAPMSTSIRAIGRLTYDETRLKDVTLKVKGWIVRMHVNASGQPVKRGEELFTLYSPELFAAQQEYLLALRSQKEAGAAGRSDALRAAAEMKLRLWDVTPAQLAAIARRGEPIKELPILAPASGYVIEKDVVEGAAVEPGQRLYRIAALDKIWIEAQVYELDLARVKKGQKARVSLPYQAGEPLEGQVAYVYPYLDPTSRTGRVRIEVPNRDLAFKPDMYANVELRVDLGPRIQVPLDSVVYTGPRRLVFVDVGEGRIRPQVVTLGARNNDAVEVTSGLSEGQVIVTSANFLVAAESRIRSAAQFWSDEPKAPSPTADSKAPAESKEMGHGTH
jgi:Cu(I)/Ag(I) efflux system membrane fusion protein